MSARDTDRDPNLLPTDLPAPVDDGAADHLRGADLPPMMLPSTDGGLARIDTPPDGYERLVIYAYPLTGLPGVDNPDGWDAVPGARGCTPESCAFRDHAAELAAAGAAVAGLSTQSCAYQQEVARRLHLPFPLLSDYGLQVTRVLKLPTFTARLRAEHDDGGVQRLLKRLTLVVRGGTVEHVFYPVFPPDTHAAEVLGWLADH